MKIFLVGGAVRDSLLNYPCHERDWVVVGATPEQLLKLGYTAIGKDFPVFLHPQTKEEYALARTERKTGQGYTGFHFYSAQDVTLEQDLARRDLTINAIAQDQQGNIIDPYNGRQDIENKLLRHVSSSFLEDPVRILRVARFAARYHHLGFTIADETQLLMRQMVLNGEVDHLVANRVWKEMNRALLERNPDIFFTVLRDCGALARILPELDALFGVPQRADYHPEIDTGIHTLMSLQQACILSESDTVRFATLMHDLGKAKTPKQHWPSHHGHEALGLKPIKSLCQRLAIPNNHRDLALIVSEFHLLCHKVHELKATTIVKTLERLDAFRRPQRFFEFLLCCEADARGRIGSENKAYPSADYFSQALRVCQEVPVEALIKQGFTGRLLGEKLHAARVSAIKELQNAHS